MKRAKICVWGTPPNLEYPNRLAEEYAMLDVLSGGRLEVAFPLGTGMEYWAHPVNPATSRQRYRESLDIILKCWTEDGPQQYYGDFYTYRFLNPWPQPLQKPYPPCYIVGTGSPETIELAAELGFGYSAVFVTRDKARELNDKLRERSAHLRPQDAARAAAAGRHDLCRRDRGKGGEGRARAHALLLRGPPADDPAIPGASRLLSRSSRSRRAPRSATRCTVRSTSRSSAT